MHKQLRYMCMLGCIYSMVICSSGPSSQALEKAPHQEAQTSAGPELSGVTKVGKNAAGKRTVPGPLGSFVVMVSYACTLSLKDGRRKNEDDPGGPRV